MIVIILNVTQRICRTHAREPATVCILNSPFS